MLPASRDRQRGIAVLTAILVVAIATVLAVNLLWGTSVDIQRTQGLLAQAAQAAGRELEAAFLVLDEPLLLHHLGQLADPFQAGRRVFAQEATDLVEIHLGQGLGRRGLAQEVLQLIADGCMLREKDGLRLVQKNYFRATC